MAHPFRLAGTHVATVDEGSEQAVAQAIAVLTATRRGERPLVPAFGVTDPVFDRIDLAEINAGLALYGPDDVVAVDLAVEWPEPGLQRATLTYELQGGR